MAIDRRKKRDKDSGREDRLGRKIMVSSIEAEAATENREQAKNASHASTISSELKEKYSGESNPLSDQVSVRYSDASDPMIKDFVYDVDKIMYEEDSKDDSLWPRTSKARAKTKVKEETESQPDPEYYDNTPHNNNSEGEKNNKIEREYNNSRDNQENKSDGDLDNSEHEKNDSREKTGDIPPESEEYSKLLEEATNPSAVEKLMSEGTRVNHMLNLYTKYKVAERMMNDGQGDGDFAGGLAKMLMNMGFMKMATNILPGGHNSSAVDPTTEVTKSNMLNRDFVRMSAIKRKEKLDRDDRKLVEERRDNREYNAAEIDPETAKRYLHEYAELSEAIRRGEVKLRNSKTRKEARTITENYKDVVFWLQKNNKVSPHQKIVY